MLLGMVQDENCVNTKTAFHLVGVFNEGNDTGQIPVGIYLDQRFTNILFPVE